ncbi:MAG: helix-turn-helix domain-containing protein [Ramlibacter sp.]|nr:helix-turn-helix domain-containing protein [Ramlibacter sp.]
MPARLPVPAPEPGAAPTRTHAGEAGALIRLSTEGVAPHERADYWHDVHLGRMALSGITSSRDAPFEGRVRRVLGSEAHLMTHASGALDAERSAAQCRRDGIDYVSLNLMLDCAGGAIDHHGPRTVKTGSVYFIDSAQPVKFRLPAHESVSIFIPRQKLETSLGTDLRQLPRALEARSGIGAVLQSHMRMCATQAEFMPPEQRVVVISACVEMALAAVQTAREGAADADQFASGVYEAARQLIARHCGDPQLDPARVAAQIGCSRATLYRLFARHGESVAALIWRSRLERARHMMGAAPFARLPLADIAFHSGFLDQASFSRMFKRHYGLTPGEARAGAVALKPAA